MKKTFSFILSLVILITLIPGSVFAKEDLLQISTNSELTPEEISILTNEVGLTKDKFEYYPIEILRKLIAQDARIISNGQKKSFDFTDEGDSSNNIGDITIFGEIPDSDLDFYGDAYLVNSDRAGHKKIYMYAEFDWNIDPVWALTDKLVVGFPESIGWFLPASGGDVVQHKTVYCHQLYYYSPEVCSTKTVPTNSFPNAGVATSFNLNFNAEYHRGFIEQNAYVESSKSGTTNLLFTYGHKLISGSPTVTVFPAGLGITPTVTTDVAEYIIEVDY